MRVEGAVVCGEGYVGVILPDLDLGRDAPLAAALVLQLLSEGEQTLSQIVSDYPRYAIVKDKLDRPSVPLDAVYNALRSTFIGAQVDTQDGLRLSWPDSWVHVRPSGTEPIVRVIAEAPTVDAARALVARSREPLDALVG
jgi:phosphomannomutase